MFYKSPDVVSYLLQHVSTFHRTSYHCTVIWWGYRRL